MNMIYGLACSLCDGNTEHALLATSVAVLEHRTIPVGLPLHIRFDLPLTLETDRNFDDRVAALPVHVYSDTISDRDKLQHFFFSSYFQRIFGMGWMTRSIGDLVEIGEEAFIVGGEYDNRDRHANADGVRFARRTIGNSPAMPSTSLTPNP